jgi:DNA-binding GntR family transcriptional regulator
VTSPNATGGPPVTKDSPRQPRRETTATTSTGPSPAVIPQYVQIAADLRDRIRDGTYGPGALLPSRNEIIASYGVSQITARDALSVISHEGLAKAVRGRGHIVRRKRPRLTLPSRLYGGSPDPGVPLDLLRLDVYQEIAPDNIALPLEAGDTPAWVRRAVWAATADSQPIQIHVAWITGLDDAAENTIRAASPAAPWPEAVQQITGRAITAVLQRTRARRANPFETDALGLADAATVVVAHLTTYDDQRRPIDHSRWTWPTDAVRISDYYSYPPRASH